MRQSCLLFILLVPAISFSQEKCSELFSVTPASVHSVVEAEIRLKLEAMVTQLFLIEKNQYASTSQLQQAKENLAKQLNELVSVNPSYLMEFRRLQTAMRVEIESKISQLKKTKVAEDKIRKETIKNYQVFRPEHKLSLKADASDEVSFSPDAKYVASYDVNANQVEIYDVVTGSLVRKLSNDTFNRKALVRFSSDGKNLLVNTRYSTQLYDLVMGKHKISLYAENSYQINFSPDAKYLATAFTKLGQVKIYDVATGSLVHELTKTRFKKTESVKFSSDSRNLLVITEVGTELYDVVTGKHKISLKAKNSDIVNFSPDAKYVASIIDKKIGIYDVATGSLVYSLAHQYFNTTTSVKFSSDSKNLLVTTENGTLMYAVDSGKFRTSMYAHNSNQVNFSPDAKYVASIIDGSNKKIGIYDVATRSVVHVLDHRHFDRKMSVKFSSDSRNLLVIWKFGTEMYDVVTGNHKISMDANDSDRVNFSADAKFVASIRGSDQVEIYDVTTGRLLHELGNNSFRTTTSVNFSSDSKNLLVTTEDGTEMFSLFQSLEPAK